jgi:5-methylcytosine-specific restriction protein B
LPSPIPVHDAADDADLLAMVSEAQHLVTAHSEAQVEVSLFIVDLPPNPKLVGFDDAIYRQIKAAIESGKRHLMFYGPPGTGKTELARYVAEQIAPEGGYTMLTGSADWSSQDLIGGYQPTGGGNVAFVPGILLKNFDKPLIIDELNRCDIDKVLGPLFTVLSKASTTLPYRVDVKDPDSAQFTILGEYDPDAKSPIYSPHPDWRIMATINTIDKASLYQMSYALSRRFAWIFVDVPGDLDGFIRDFLALQEITIAVPDGGLVLKHIWEAVNKHRLMGPAPFIDVIWHCRAADAAFDFAAPPTADAARTYLDAFRVHVMPMLDGLLKGDLQAVAAEVSAALRIGVGDERAKALSRHIEALGL